ncbi:helix-turn-helix domain containing protein (plasmid) [Burkholderia vietnamiensis]|uniref:Bacteriophage CI repressor n=1 Tax=Burkholderia vietnamiensis (strain G4 / LMG 22486) TaxID=269482 RepID=A4JU53_BURVG|nr:bacteriophage CI repressor [Burkholderia vietnamiensis G4]MCB4350032.1 helix-turn-helix domain containing protein [Burkholderia vietnamiensis]
MAIDAHSQRSTRILINLAASMDELGKPIADGTFKLTSNIRLAASAGAAALSQLQGIHASGETTNARHEALDTSVPREVNLLTPGDWLDRLKTAKGFHADIALAEYLGISKSLFSQWRTGKVALTVEESWRLALELGVSPLQVIASVQYHAAEGEKRTAWRHLAASIADAKGASVIEQTDRSMRPAAPNPEKPSAGPAEFSAGSEKQPGLESKGTKWPPVEDERLVSEYQALTPIPEIALLHRRSIAAILYRLYKNHDLIPDDVMQSLCERYKVKFDPKVQASKSEEGQQRGNGGSVFL